jgi:hypothetical protein
MLAIYIVLLCHPPSFLFPYSFKMRQFSVYSDEPIPQSMAVVLNGVTARISRSPFYQKDKSQRIYLCNKNWLFALFTGVQYRVGGFAPVLVTDNVFLRKSYIGLDRLVGPSGVMPSGERTLTYYIAHEITHVMTGYEVGRVGCWRLPVWKRYGYADYIAKGNNFDYEKVLLSFKHNNLEMDPKRSGLYLRYHLLVAYLLDKKKMSLEQLFFQNINQDDIEKNIMTEKKV